jgi:putative transcriptional regulator
MNTKPRKPFADRVRAGLQDALAHARGERTLKSVTHPDAPPEIDAETLVALRTAASMSQAVFAKVLSTSPKTVQSWEQGKRTPSPAARRLIQMFAVEPETLCRLVGLPGVTLTGFAVRPATNGKFRIVRLSEPNRPSKKLKVEAGS